LQNFPSQSHPTKLHSLERQMTISIEHAKTITITYILDKLNIQPARENEKEAFYLSPLRQEQTASFHVDKVKNRWCDFGTGEKGDIIDFVQHFLAYTGEDSNIVDALRWIENMSKGISNINPIIPNVPLTGKIQPKLILKSVSQITDIRLVRYLENRGISLDIATVYLKEIIALNTTTDKRILALGLLNENEGYEISNKFFKSSVKGKNISVIRGSNPTSKILHIYEGKMDFLSSLTRLGSKTICNDVIVLNSLSFLEHAKEHINAFGYNTVYSFLDNDDAGKVATKSLEEFLKTMPGIIHKPMNIAYQKYKDVNDWHVANPILRP